MDKILINYFGNSSVLNCLKIKKSHNWKIYWVVSSQANVKRVSREFWEGKHHYFFLWPYLHPICYVSNVLEKVIDLTTLNILRTTRAMLLNFCFVNTPKCQILTWVCKVLCLFKQIFASEKVKGNFIKRQKISALKRFSLSRYSKKWTA